LENSRPEQSARGSDNIRLVQALPPRGARQEMTPDIGPVMTPATAADKDLGDLGRAAGGKGWSRPLRLHLSVVIVILLLSIALPLMWLTYQQGTRSAVTAADQQMLLLSRHAIDRYRGVFGDGLSAITLLSATEAFLTEPPADLEAKTDLLVKALAGSPYIDGIYAGYPSGGFVHAVSIVSDPAWAAVISAPDRTTYAVRTIETSASGRTSTWRFYDADEEMIGERAGVDASYDPTGRPWYKAASKSAVPVSVGPYVMATTQMLGLTIATAMEKDQAIVIGADVILETISRLLHREAVSSHSAGYVFDDRQRLIVHSDPQMMKRLLDSLAAPGNRGELGIDDPVLDAVRVLLAGEHKSDQAVNFDVGGKPYLAQIVTTGNADLIKGNTVVIAAPISDFTGASIELLRKALAVSGILLLAGILSALVVARLISRSLSSLTRDAEQIGNLEFGGGRGVWSNITEINSLAGALGSAREAIRTFALYVPRELVRKIVASGQSVVGSAMRQEVTVLFTDIRDFTTISEQHSPEEVVALLSAYFQVMNDIVESHNGVIVQYLGDSIYAMWNAPEPDPEHVDDGCRCTLALKAGIDRLNEQNRRNGLPELVTRFGLHTGVAVVGSVGAEARRQYTAMGDTVNVASRLEGINKEFGTSILASGALRKRAGPQFSFRPLGLARAKGRSKEIEIFELTGAS